MANDNFIRIYGLLRSLSRTSKQNVRENLLNCNEKIRGLKEWQKTAIEHLQNSDKVKKKNVKVKSTPQTFKFRSGRSVSFPVGKKYKGKKKLSFLKKAKCSRKVRLMLLEETPKVPENRRTRSFSRDMLESYKAKSEKELLEMHAEVTIKYDEVFRSPDTIQIGPSKRKSIIELLETGGVKAKQITQPSSSSGTLMNSSEGSGNSFSQTFCEKNNPIENETPLFPSMRAEVLLDTSGVKSKVFLERLSTNGQESPDLFGELPDSSQTTSSENIPKTCHNSHALSSDPVPRLEATFTFESKKSNDCSAAAEMASSEKQARESVEILDPDHKTPLRSRTSNGSRKSLKPERLSPSTSDTRIIKKKNLTSYLTAKTVDNMTVPKSEKPKQEIVGMQLRLRERPVIVKEIKPIAKKRSKRTRSNDEEMESKLKRREESVKQQKHELQVKAEERRLRREERMRKTKETREKLEKERLEKVQISGGKKRQLAESVREGELPKKMRTRQHTKRDTEEKIVVKVKVSKKRKSSTAAVKRKQKLKRSLATVAETESEEASSPPQKSPPRLPKKTKPKIGKQTVKSKGANSTFSLKNQADAVSPEKPVGPKSPPPKPESLDNTNSQPPASSTFVCNTTFDAKTSSPAANKQLLTAASQGIPSTSVNKTPAPVAKTPANVSKFIATPFKTPTVTPLPKSKQSGGGGSSSKKNNETRGQSSTTSYDMTPYRGDDEDSNDDEPRKPIPNWASGIRLKEAIIKQAYHPPNVDRLFGPLKRTVNLVDIFGRHHRKYRQRTSSAVWKNISFAFDDSMSQHNNSSILF